MVEGRMFQSGKRTLSAQPTRKSLRFDVNLFTLARAAGFNDVDSPMDAVRVLCDMALPPQCVGRTGDTLKNIGLEAEVLILDAIEGVLERYGELGVSSSVGRKELPAAILFSASLANLRSIATFFLRRPALPSQLLAAFFQLTILVVKHAPPQALDVEGCRVLVSLLELLGCLPRGAEDDGGPGIQQVARITGRNIMRRVCPRIFHPDVTDVFNSAHQDTTAAVSSVAVSEQVDRDLLPWVERQLLPLHVVSGEDAQANLREDRRLAFLLLEYLCFIDNVNTSLSSSRRIAILYIADAVASLFEGQKDSREIAGKERQVALSFLEWAKRALLSESVSAVSDMRVCSTYGDFQLNQPTISTQDAQKFLLCRDAAYVREFGMLHQRIEEEHENHDILQWQLRELTREREEVLRELRAGLFDSRVPQEEGAASCTSAKECSPPAADVRETSLFSSCEWDVESFLQPLEGLTVLLHDRRQREHSSSF